MQTTASSQHAVPQGHTPDEQHNVDLVREYMEIAYTPGRASAEAVSHLCSPGNRFIAPTTFPDLHTLGEYAEDHGRLMEQVNDLNIDSFDVLFAKGDRVCRRYTAEGTHRGKPHGDIPPTDRTARWSAAALFQIRDGKLVEFIKDWNEQSMWEQLGWPVDECLTQTGQG
jgi:predicted ester cyclase